MTTTEIRKELETQADEKYRVFHAALLPGIENVLGIRVPLLREIAKRLAKQKDWRLFVEDTKTKYNEEVMLQGMIIGMAKTDLEEQIKYIRLFIPRIKNWGVCDVFCSELKTVVQKGKDAIWDMLPVYLQSEKEFEVRFGTVMLFHYIDKAHIDRLLENADHFSHEAYYARMGMAWLLSGCFVKFPEETMAYLKKSKLNTWTYNKTLQKIAESLRVNAQTKEKIRRMKRRLV